MVKRTKCMTCKRDMYVPNSNNVIYSIISKKYSKMKCPKCVDHNLTFIQYVNMIEDMNKESR